MVSTFEIFMIQIVLVFIVSFATGRQNSYSNVAANSTITVMAGGTLIYEQRILGFVLLLYGIFLMTFAAKEFEEQKSRSGDDLLGKFVKIIGHYFTVSLVLISILVLEYRPELLLYFNF